MQSDRADMHQDFGYAANLVSNLALNFLSQMMAFLNGHLGINQDMEVHPHHAAHTARSDLMTAPHAIDAPRYAGDTFDVGYCSIA